MSHKASKNHVSSKDGRSMFTTSYLLIKSMIGVFKKLETLYYICIKWCKYSLFLKYTEPLTSS